MIRLVGDLGHHLKWRTETKIHGKVRTLYSQPVLINYCLVFSTFMKYKKFESIINHREYDFATSQRFNVTTTFPQIVICTKVRNYLCRIFFFSSNFFICMISGNSFNDQVESIL